MNVRRGYRRFSIAIVGTWIVTWACIGGFAAWQQGIWSELFIESMRKGQQASIEYTHEYTTWYGKLIALSLAGGAFTVPIIILLALGWWVYRGFSTEHDKP